MIVKSTVKHTIKGVQTLWAIAALNQIATAIAKVTIAARTLADMRPATTAPAADAIGIATEIATATTIATVTEATAPGRTAMAVMAIRLV